MQNESPEKPKTEIKEVKPKKILIKKAALHKARKVFGSLDIPFDLFLKKNDQNNSTSDNIKIFFFRG